jgi:hypothetical protein
MVRLSRGNSRAVEVKGNRLTRRPMDELPRPSPVLVSRLGMFRGRECQ